jgi:Transcription termination factor nusG
MRPAVAESSAADPYWAVVHTHPQAERWAQQNLTRMGYETYLPLTTVTRRDRVTPTIRHRVEIPLFSRYLFVNLRSDQRWGPVRYAAGVHQLLRNDGKPCRLDAGVISLLRAGEALRAGATPGKSSWATGMACSPATGVLRGHSAIVLAVNGKHARIGVLFLGHLREISLPLECLAPIAA